MTLRVHQSPPLVLLLADPPMRRLARAVGGGSVALAHFTPGRPAAPEAFGTELPSPASSSGPAERRSAAACTRVRESLPEAGALTRGPHPVAWTAPSNWRDRPAGRAQGRVA